MKTLFPILLSSKKAKKTAMTTSIVALILIVFSSPHFLIQAAIAMTALVIQIFAYYNISRIYKGYVVVLSDDQKETKEGMGWQIVIFAIMFISSLISWGLA